MSFILQHIYYERRKRNFLRIFRKHLRDTLNPFDIDEESFRTIYRYPPQLAIQFIEELREEIDIECIKEVPLHLQFLATLNFYASGSYQRRVGMDAFTCLSQTVISRCISHISYIIGNKMSKKYVTFPTSAEEIQTTKNSFNEKYNCPGIVGVIDGTHIALTGLPKTIEYSYMNRKGFHSLNVQIVCNSEMEITNVNARHHGSTHDSFIFACSNVYSFLEQIHHNNDRIESEINDNFTYLLGDLGYPILLWLCNIFRRPQNEQERCFNMKLIKIRSIIERCIGILKARFRCISSERPLKYMPDRAANIVYSCVVLHNFLIRNN